MMDCSVFVKARREAGKSDKEIVEEIVRVNWAIRQGYRKPLENFNKDQVVLFTDNLPRNEE